MSEEKYIPKSKIGQWFDSRLPLLSLAHHLRCNTYFLLNYTNSYRFSIGNALRSSR